MNMFEGKIAGGALRADDVAMPAHLSEGRYAVAGVRPEDLVAVDPANAPIKGVIRTVEFLGSRTLLRVDVGTVVVAAFVPLGMPFAAREAVGLAPSSPDRVRWFAADTGIALA